MDTIGIILAGIGALIIAGLTVFLTKSIIFGIIVFVIGFGYLFYKWIEAGVPYDIHDIRNELRDKK